MDAFKYTVDPDLDEVIDERGNTVVMLRRVAWGDRDFGRPEVRKWHLSEGKERADKGVTFLTDDGPANLAKMLIRKGFGDTKEYLEVLQEREDFENSLIDVIGIKKYKAAKEKESNEVFYDPREVLK